MRGFFFRGVLSAVVIALITLSNPISLADEPAELCALQTLLVDAIQDMDAQVSVVYDALDQDLQIRLFPSRRFNSASVIKLPILVVYEQLFSEGVFDETDFIVLQQHHKLSGSGKLYYHRNGSRYTLRQLLTTMITYSDNTATVMLIEHVGLSRLNQGFKDIGLSNTAIGTWDLLHAQTKNYTTSDDMSFLLRQLYVGAIVNSRVSLSILNLLSRQTYRWGIPHYLPKEVRVANKTGTLNHMAHDVGIVFLDDKPYSLSVFIAASTVSFSKCRQRVAQISQIVYDQQ